jgi:formylglycine-generating enzyme required for sulfatase activity
MSSADLSDRSCCSPGSPDRRRHVVSAEPGNPKRGNHGIEQARIPAGSFLMGDGTGNGNPGDGETPVHEVKLPAFEIDATTVTNEHFARFVESTGYRTDAELFGFSAVFHLVLETSPENLMDPVPSAPWWVGVRCADWAHPGGLGSSIAGQEDHPVVHVSWHDAVAYCRWAGRRLPTEAEWERASRGGIESAAYPWGDALVDPATGEWLCNIWQGPFPQRNTLDDGWLTTAPVRAYTPNGFGLWQTVGNVWEWCSDRYTPTYYKSSPRDRPSGPSVGTRRVLRGGSYLCHDSYCNRYRNSARSSNTPDSSMGNTGFRTVGSIALDLAE